MTRNQLSEQINRAKSIGKTTIFDMGRAYLCDVYKGADNNFYVHKLVMQGVCSLIKYGKLQRTPDMVWYNLGKFGMWAGLSTEHFTERNLTAKA